MKIRSRIMVFILSFLVWLALTGKLDLQHVIVGLLVSALVSLSAGHLLVTTVKKNSLFKRCIYGVGYLFIFVWEMIKANVHVAYIVLHPKLPINPGIVRIRTRLKKDTSLTILSNSITLTPGTLTVDISPRAGYLYIHHIDVKSEDTGENTRLIGARFEPILTEVFE